MFANSRSVSSNQTGCHDDLEELVEKHLRHEWRAPIADHDRAAFDEACRWRKAQGGDRALIFDSGCGTGRSSVSLAHRFPEHLVFALDQSEHRLSRAAARFSPLPPNLKLIRTDCAGFWRLARQAGWHLTAHYLLYPNPWPKRAHVKRRWHGHPVWPTVLALGGELTVRSNWQIYLLEVQKALALSGIEARLGECDLSAGVLTDFEEKYQASGHHLWELKAALS